VTYTSETWVLKETIIQKLLVFERKILRMFGSTKENHIWRIKTNEELDKLIKHKNLVNYIKAQRLSWFFTYKECQIPEQLRRYLIGNP
jgi:acyl-ACP thioesterase